MRHLLNFHISTKVRDQQKKINLYKAHTFGENAYYKTLKDTILKDYACTGLKER